MQKLKIGDKVNILWEKTSYQEEPEYENIGTIINIINEPTDLRAAIIVDGFKKNSDSYALAFKEDELSLLEEKKRVAKFKLGDEVKLSNSASLEDDTFKGALGLIVFIHLFGNKLKYLVYLGPDFNGHSGSSSGFSQSNKNNWWFEEFELEAAPKIGDRVRISNSVSDFNEGKKEFLGAIGTVVDVDNSSMPYLVYLGPGFCGHTDGENQDNNHNWWFYPKDVKVVEQDTPEQDTPEQEMKFKVGDNVRVVTKEEIGRNNKSHFGMLGKVVGIDYINGDARFLVYLGNDFKGNSGFGSLNQPNSNNWYFSDNKLELASEFVEEGEEIMSDFKVGDRVKINVGVGSGITGIIKYELIGNDYLVLLEDGRAILKNGDWLELVNNQEKEKENIMNKSNLNQGALVELRNGGIYILIGKRLVNLECGGYMPLMNYDEDLLLERVDTISDIDSKYDIMKVFNPHYLLENEGYREYINNSNISWHWERQELKEPKFKVDEWVKTPDGYGKIISVKANINRYEVDLGHFLFSCFEEHELSKVE